MRVNSKLPTQGKRFCQTLDHSRDQEIPCQFNCVCGVRVLTRNERLLTNRVEKWPAALDLFGWPSGNNEQLCGGCGVRPAEHWRGPIVLLLFAMTFSQKSRQPDADGAHGNMNGARRKGLYDITRLKDNSFQGRVIRQPGDERLCLGRGASR